VELGGGDCDCDAVHAVLRYAGRRRGPELILREYFNTKYKCYATKLD
jgi:hypothetical protein